jgi:maltose O-acetyltransferase
MFCKIGKNVYLARKIDFLFPFNIQIGDNSVINKYCTLDGRGGKIIIADNVDVAQEVNIWTAEHDPNDRNHDARTGNVIIEDHCWIASRVTILPGVTIHRGAVVSCGAVVTKDVPEMAIVGGIPAKIIAIRNNDCKYILKTDTIF